MKKKLYILFLSQLCLRAVIPHEDTSLVSQFDTNYIKSYPHYLSIALFSRLPSSNINIISKRNVLLRQFQSNLSNQLGFDIDYQGISLMVAFQTKSDFKQIQTKGKSEFRGIALKIYKHKVYANISYNTTIGFFDKSSYLKNSNDSLHPYTILPHLKTQNFNLSGLYNINHKKYSYLAPGSYTERQVKSKGGWLLAGGFNLLKISNNNPLLSSPKNNNLTQDTLIKSYNNYFIKLGLGRGMNLIIFRRLFFNLQLMTYGNLAIITTKENLADKANFSPNIFLEGSACIGYNSKRFFTGIKFMADRYSARLNQLKQNYSQGSIQFNIGYRFNSPNWLDKGYENAKSYIKNRFR